jgi:hypothetical protein
VEPPEHRHEDHVEASAAPKPERGTLWNRLNDSTLLTKAQAIVVSVLGVAGALQYIDRVRAIIAGAMIFAGAAIIRVILNRHTSLRRASPFIAPVVIVFGGGAILVMILFTGGGQQKPSASGASLGSLPGQTKPGLTKATVSISRLAPNLYQVAALRDLGLPQPQQRYLYLIHRGALDVFQTNLEITMRNPTAHDVVVRNVQLQVASSRPVPRRLGATYQVASQGESEILQLQTRLTGAAKGSVAAVYKTAAQGTPAPYYKTRIETIHAHEVYIADLSVQSSIELLVAYRIVVDFRSAMGDYTFRSKPFVITEIPKTSRFAKSYTFDSAYHGDDGKVCVRQGWTETSAGAPSYRCLAGKLAPALKDPPAAVGDSDSKGNPILRQHVEPNGMNPYSDVGLDDLVWSGWGSPSATATGTASVNSCKPNCAAANYVQVAGARVTARRLVKGVCEGQPRKVYTELVVSVPASSAMRAFSGVVDVGNICRVTN